MQAFSRLRWRTAILIPAAAALTACSLLSPTQRKAPEPVAEPAPPAALPLATHRFEFDPQKDDVVGQVQATIVGPEDTLSDIARRFNLGYEELLRANPGVDPWLPGEGREIVLPTQFVLPSAPREGVVINVPAMRLFYYVPQEKPKAPARKKGEPAAAKAAAEKTVVAQKAVVITHPIGIGKIGWATPEGSTKILRRTKGPTWTVPASVRKEHAENGDPLPPVVPPGPDNPLGEYAFYLGWPSYLIHGTNKPYGVGMRSSHGCIRLYPEDIRQLFEELKLPIGTKIQVVNQPFVFGRTADGLVIQPFGVLEDDKRDWEKSHRKLLDKTISPAIRQALKERQQDIDWAHVETLVDEPRGVPVPVAKQTTGVAATPVGVENIILTAHKVQNVLPRGATWDGRVEIDAERLQDVLSLREAEQEKQDEGKTGDEARNKQGNGGSSQ